MHLMTYRGFVAEVGHDPQRGVYVGTLCDVPAAIRFQATTPAGLPEQMARVVDDYIATVQEWGLPCAPRYNGDRRVRFGRVLDAT